MKVMHNGALFRIGLAMALSWTLAGLAAGGILPPLYAGNLEPVLDQYGRPMAGSPTSPAGRCLVELRTTTDGIVRPPFASGAPHPYNPLLQADSVGGVGMNASEPNSGLFCLVFSNRPGPGTKVFARAYNAATIEDATFYADSALVEVPAHNGSLVLTFGAARALDDGDDDGDGLANSWEQALGTFDRPTADYDGDGMSDLHEMLAGTAPDDPDSKLAFRLVKRATEVARPAGAGPDWQQPVRVTWQSVPGKQYQLEYVPMLTVTDGEPPVFVPVGDIVTAAAGEYDLEMLVEVPADVDTGTFRVRLCTE